MHRRAMPICLLVLAAAAGGCQDRPIAAHPQPVLYSNCSSMPLAVGDSVGAAVFTTRQSLAARGIQTDVRTASAPER